MFLSQFMYTKMTWFVTSICSFLCWFVFKIFFFLEKYIDRRIVDENDEMNCRNQKRLDFDEKGVEKERSFLMQSKYEYVCRQDSFGFMEKPEAKSFSVQEMFVNFNEEKEEIDKNSDHKLFYFSFFNDGKGHQEHVHEIGNIGEKAKSEGFGEKNGNDQEKLEVIDEKNANDQEKLEFFDGKNVNDQEKLEVFDEKNGNDQEKLEVIDEKNANDQEKLEVFDGKNVNDQEKLEVFDEKNANDQEKLEVIDEKNANDQEKFVVFDGKNVNDQEKLEVFDEKNDNDQEKLEVFDEKNANDQEKTEDHVGNLCCGEIWKQNDEASSDEETQNFEDICYEIQLLPENQSLVRNSILGSDAIGNELCSDRCLNGFLNSDQFMEVVREENDDMGFIELETSLHKSSSSISIDEFASKNVDGVEGTDVNYEEMKLMDDFQESIDHNLSRKSWDRGGFASKNVDSVEVTDVNYEEVKLMDDFQESPYHNSSRKSWDTDSDEDEDECDILLKHQNLVRQMKMEMKNSRITGLPTISEDCESPKVVEDLKPLKIDEKIEYKDCIEEIQKFYKSYADKMRKLDISNYQTLNAISFLQLKDSEVFMSSKKSSISITKAFVLSSFLANKQRKIFADPSLKSISEMNGDLEIVYVGQICLSWEILCWQYGKSKELLEHDPHEYHTYNQVAGEYQQFQVLLQRFVEDEPFQGPRVQNYVRKRCILRSFLQVPSIRDDRSKGKQGGCEGEKDVISIVKLAEIIEETMQFFCHFLRADKREANLALKGVHGTQMDTAEIKLFMSVKLDLQKKERKLKDVQRSGNCIVKKFQKQQERRLSHSLFASLVELKLVSRVLSLPRLRRDYLVWCQSKLSMINVAGRKVSMEQSFSLFPC